MLPHRIICKSSIAAFLAAFATVSAQAQNNWVGSSGALWSAGTNWTTGAAPVSLDDVIFPSPVPASGAAVTLSAGQVANTLEFQDAYTLTGGDLTLTAGTVTVSPSITATINSVLAGTSAMLNKAGAGTLVLGGANTYGGLTTVGAGVLRLQHASALGATAAGTSVSDGAALELQGGLSFGAEALTLNGMGVFGGGALRNLSGDNTWKGAVTLAGASSIISEADTLTFDVASGAAISGTFNLTFGGAGNIVLRDALATGTTAAPTILTKEGTGTLQILADPSTVGTMVINGGVVELNHSGSADFSTVINDGATFRTLTVSISDNVDVTVNAGGTFDFRSGSDTMGALSGAGIVTRGGAGAATLSVNNGGKSSTFSGVIENGSAGGTVHLSKVSTGTLTLTGANTYTGNLQISGGTVLVQGAEARASAGNFVIVGDNNSNDERLVVDSASDTVTGTLDHLSDTATVRFNGTTSITYNGPAAGSTGTTETVANLDYAAGAGVLTLDPAAGGELQISATALQRSSNNASGVIRGTGLGLAAGTADSSRVIFTTAPTTIGAGGSGSQASIIPHLMGGNSTTAAPNTFLRYDATNGVTLLGDSDYEAAIAGSTGRNVSVTGDQTLSTSETINALRAAGGTITLGAGMTLGVDSGAILFTGNGAIDGPGILNFGTRQGLFHASSDTGITADINAKLTGTAGFVVGDAGNAVNTVVLGADNAILGTIVLNNGILRAGSAGALNKDFFNDFVLRAGNSGVTGATSSALQLGGNSLSVIFGGNDPAPGEHADPECLGDACHIHRGFQCEQHRQRRRDRERHGGGVLSFTKRGTALLGLDGANTFTGSAQILGGTLVLTSSSGGLKSTPSIAIEAATLRLTSSSTNNTDRLFNTAAVALHSGTFDFDHNGDSNQSFSETTGALTLGSGANTITVDRASASNSRTSTLTFASLTRTAGATVNFSGQSNNTADFNLGKDRRSRVVFTSYNTGALDNGIIGGWATVDSGVGTREFAKYVADAEAALSGNQPSVTALVAADYATALLSGSFPAQNVKITATPDPLTNTSEINSLNIAQASDTTVDLGGQSLRVESGGVIVSGDFDAQFTNGTLTAGTGSGGGELIFHTIGAAANPVKVTASIANNGTGVVHLVKAGAGVLDLRGSTNTYTGNTYINDGELVISSDENLGASPGVATPDSLFLAGGTLTLASANVALSSNRGITLGAGNSTLNAASGSNLFYNGNIVTAPNRTSSLTLKGNVDATLGDGVAFNDLTITGVTGAGAASELMLGGANNSVGGSLRIGIDSNGAGRLLYTTPGGSLSVGTLNPNISTLDVGVRTNATVTTLSNGTLYLAGTSSFLARVNDMRVGISTTGSGAGGTVGSVTLANNNDIQALRQILISDSVSESLGGQISSVVFGSGTDSVTTITTPLLTVGARKGNANATLPTGGTLNLQGFLDRSLDLYVGRNNTNTGTISKGILDLTNGTLNGNFDAVTVARKDGGGVGGSYGAFRLGSAANQIVANTLAIASNTGDIPVNTSSYNFSYGLLSMAGGSFTVAGDARLAEYSDTTGGTEGAARGDLTLTGGTFTIGGDITKSADVRSSSIITVDGGTLDLRDNAAGDATEGSITASQLAFRSGSIVDVASLTLDGNEVTVNNAGTVSGSGLQSFSAPAPLEHSLILRDVALSAALHLTNPAENKGGVLYEAAGGGAGGSITGALDLGDAPGRTVTVEDSAGAATDLVISGAISGSATLNKAGDGVLGLNSANTYSGGTSISDGSLLASSNGALGTGDVSVLDTAVSLTIQTGVSNAIADTATLSLSGGGTAGLADAGFISLGAGVSETIGGLILDGVAQAMGTYGSSLSNATVKNDEFFSGTGVVTVIPEPGSAVMLLCGIASLVGFQRFRGQRR